MTSQLPQRPIYQKGQKPAKVPALRNAAKGAECTLRIACWGDVVSCHARFFNLAGEAQKVDDLFLIDGCQGCHHILDHRNLWAEHDFGWDDVMRALMQSQLRRRAAGLIILKGESYE